MKRLMFLATIACILSACASPSLQHATDSIVASNCNQCQKDHYEYSGPYQFQLGAKKHD